MAQLGHWPDPSLELDRTGRVQCLRRVERRRATLFLDSGDPLLIANGAYKLLLRLMLDEAACEPRIVPHPVVHSQGGYP